MLRLKFVAAAVACIATASAITIGCQRRGSATSAGLATKPSINRLVETVRLSPAGDPSGEVECASFEPVDFAYQIVNRGQAPINGLKLGTKCSCEQLGDPPDEILPGESATISIRLRAPYVGKVQRQIPLLVDGASEPLVVLDAVLHVKFDPPALLPLPENLSVKFIQGDRSAHELAFEAIEAKREQPWIRGLQLDPLDGIEVQPLEMDELPEADPDLTRRRYRFPLVNRTVPISRQKIAATVRTREGAPPAPNSLGVWVDVVDSIAIVPNPLVIRYSQGSPPPSRQIRIIDRSGIPRRLHAPPLEWDRELLILAARQHLGSTITFELTPARMPEAALETKVVFGSENNETRELVVRFEPAE